MIEELQLPGRKSQAGNSLFCILPFYIVHNFCRINTASTVYCESFCHIFKKLPLINTLKRILDINEQFEGAMFMTTDKLNAFCLSGLS